MKKSGLSILLLALTISASQQLIAQTPWTVTDAEKKLKIAFEYSREIGEAGVDLYLKNCKSCHGDPAAGNTLPLVPKPPDLGNPDYLASVTDGEMFTKVTKGRGPMPTFEKILSEDQRWHIIAYLRSLSGKPLETGALDQSVTGKKGTAQLSLSLNQEQQTITATLKVRDEKDTLIPAPNARVLLLARRTFGMLTLKEAKTNENGVIQFEVPKDLPKDKNGNIDLIVKLKDQALFGIVEQSATVQWGAENPHVNLLETRSMWTVRFMAPIWLIITFNGGLIGIWSVLIWVILQGLKIRKQGSE